MVPEEMFVVPGSRRLFSPEYRVEAAHRVIDSGRSREVARELDVHDNLLHKWAREERRQMAAAAGIGAGGSPDDVGGQSVTVDERAESTRSRAKVAEQARDIALLEKTSTYFAARHPK